MEYTTISQNKITTGVWIGLVGVVNKPGHHQLEGAKGGFTNALAYVSAESEFKQMVTDALDHLGLVPYDFEDIEQFQLRKQRYEVDSRICELADEAQRTGRVCFGDFYTYDSVQ